jgi:hypothetical protein
MGPCWIFLVKLLPFLGKIQFPWRILSITSTLQMIAAIGALVYLQRFKWQRQIVFILVFLLLAVAINFKQFIGRYYDIPYWYTPAIFTAVQKNNIDACGGLNEFLPRTAPFEHIPPRADNPIMLSLRGMQLTARADNSDYKIHYHAVITGPDILIINQLYFPGWKVFVNGIVLDPKILEKSIEPMGRISFLIQRPGEYDIKAFYAGPPYKAQLYGAIVIIMGFSLFILFYLNRRFLRRN